MGRWLDRILALETIDGDGLCPTYLYRWRLLSLGRHFKIYLERRPPGDAALRRALDPDLPGNAIDRALQNINVSAA